VAAILAENGFKDTAALKGGFKGWVGAGYVVIEI